VKALLQRVTQATVSVEGLCIGSIDHGLLVFLGVEKTDDDAVAQRLAERVLSYRMFADAADKMNLNVQQVLGGILVVSQFTLAAQTSKGNRPGFSTAATPAEGKRLYELFVDHLSQRHKPVETGRFGADMQVSLINDGPVTFLLST